MLVLVVIKKGVEPTIEVSNSNPFDVLNSADNDVKFGTNEGTTSLVNNGATSSGSSFMNIDNDGEFASNTPICEKIDKIERQIYEGKLRLLDNDGNPLVPSGIVEIDSEVEVVFDETANLRISTNSKDVSDKGYCSSTKKSVFIAMSELEEIRLLLKEHYATFTAQIAAFSDDFKLVFADYNGVHDKREAVEKIEDALETPHAMVTVVEDVRIESVDEDVYVKVNDEGSNSDHQWEGNLFATAGAAQVDKAIKMFEDNYQSLEVKKRCKDRMHKSQHDKAHNFLMLCKQLELRVIEIVNKLKERTQRLKIWDPESR
nr:hypothetical protein [Tanacetum cinerariifolium]